MRTRTIVVATACWIATALPSAARSWQHPAFIADQRRPARLLVLPVGASMARGKLNETEGFYKESEVLARHLATALAEHLERKGYAADVLTIDADTDREMVHLVQDVQDAADRLRGNLYQRPKDVRKGRFSLGQSVLPLAGVTNVDGIVTARAQAIIPSKGNRALSGAMSVLFGGIPHVPTNKTQLEVMVADARDGLVLHFSAEVTGGPVLKHPDRVAKKVVTETLADYPAAGTAGRLTKKERRRLAELEEQSHEPEALEAEAVLAEFEKVSETLPEPPPEPTPVEQPPPDDVDDGPATSGEVQTAPATTPEALPNETPPAATARSLPADDASDADPEALRLHAVPAADRPEPTHELFLQVLDGQPAVVVVNAGEHPLRVSVDLGPFTTLPPGERLELPATIGSHRVLLTDAEGREVARTSVIVRAGRSVVAEAWPNG